MSYIDVKAAVLEKICREALAKVKADREALEKVYMEEAMVKKNKWRTFFRMRPKTYEEVRAEVAGSAGGLFMEDIFGLDYKLFAIGYKVEPVANKLIRLCQVSNDGLVHVTAEDLAALG